MNQFVRNLVWGCLSFFLAVTAVSTQGQSVFDPNDPIVIYNPSNPPTEPAFGQPGKWVKTNRVSWNTSSFKAYIYKGVQFRLKWPKNYDPSGNTKYPLLVFFHGKGERGSIYDNEYQLYHGGELHRNAVDNGTFNGFLLYPQSDASSSDFGTKRIFVMELIENFLIPELNVDPFRVNINGLSLGGYQTWQFFISYPKLVASITPISNAASTTSDYIIQNKFIPIWLFQGALDQSPVPAIAQYLNNKAQQAGANFTYTEYPNLGHGSWYAAWNEPDYFPFINRAHKANPWALFGRTEFCPNESINTTIGVTAGFDQYQWRKNDIDLTGLGTTSNTLTVTDIGIYSCRVRRGSVWSPWSPIPVEIKYKTTTIPPVIKVSGLASRVLPSPDGKTSIAIEVPGGYASYLWRKVGSNTGLGTANVLSGVTVGSYHVQVTEQFGCSSTFSTPFEVINANGPNKPDAATNLIAIPLSYTALKLNWSANPSSAYPQTNFEIYEATQSGGPYKFISLVGGDVFNFVREGLTPGVKYYYIVRSVNNTAAAPVSNEASAATQKDITPPTAPGNLHVTGTTRNYVSLAWDESVDDVGMDHYEIYVNGIKSYVTSGTEHTVYGLDFGKAYNFAIKAVDIAGNKSAASNQVTAQPLAKGLNFKHYTGSWDNLPDFNMLTPILTGVVPNVTLSNSTQGENYAFLWEGYIRIPSDGDYVFRTTSDDGSKLYLSAYSHTAQALVNNDGLHGSVSVDGSIDNLKKGVYPIAITFFQKGGGANMSISWRKRGSSGWSMAPIPDSAFVDAPQPLGGVAPATPSNLTANAVSFKRINLTWSDNSNNEKSFELFRSTNPQEDFVTIGVMPANATSFADTLVAPSTTYYYKIRAINQYGESAFDKIGPGVDYSYYEQTGMSQTPNFNTMTPVKTGRVGNFSLGIQLRANNFAVKYEGFITIPQTGSYTFYLKSDDGSRLYIDNNLVVNNDGLHSATDEISASVQLNAGTHAIRVAYFEATGDEALTVSYSGPGINKQIIPGIVLGDILANATTLAAPPAPAAPGSLNAVGVSSSVIKVTWVNNAANATRIELYRSYNNNTDYVLLATLNADATTYNDAELYPSSLFYYKVMAVGEGGNSPYSNEKSARTLGIVPSILPVENVYMRFNSTVSLPIEAVAGSPVEITLQVSNLPSFAVFQQTGNGKGTITFNPSENDQGVFNNIVVTASNPQNDINTAQFNLTVNSNYVPVLNAIPNVSVNEKQTAQINFSATDQDAADLLHWTFKGLPNFATIATSNRTATITLAPSYGEAGIYNVKAEVSDGKNGKDTASFDITVVHVDVPNPDDGTVPVKPKDVAAFFVNSLNAVKVTWTNAAYNAIRNEIYRSNKVSGNYTLLNPGATNKDSTSYLDYTATGNTTYFYLVRAVNDNGGSNSMIVKVTTPNRAPVISAGDIYVKSGNVLDAGITATDDPGNTIKLTASNLPDFATFTDNGNGSGIFHLTPTSSHIGSVAVMLKAVDNYGAESAKSIKLVVTDKYISSVYVNFNNINYPVYGQPWNSFNATLLSNGNMAANKTITNLKDETGIESGINILLPDAWPQNLLGVTTGNNSGVYPDSILQTGYYFATSTSQPFKRIRLTNLDASKKYNLIFLGSRNYGNNIEQLTRFAVGSQVVTLNSNNNINNTVQLNALTPGAQGVPGQIEVDVRGSATGKYAVINAMVIQEYDNNVIFPPINLNMAASTKNSISLSWKYNSDNATGFEVWRSDAPNGTYQPIATVAGNVFNYTDNGLLERTVYYYKVRTVSGASYSEFSDYLSAATISYAIDINFNDGFAGPAQPSPWNNINELITTGFTMNNFVNRDNQYTGIGMTVVSNFGGFNVNGPTTGNNSGPVPDNVMLSYYYMEYGVIARLRITGLNQSMRYNFIFFGSRKANGIGQTTSYSIGDQTVLLDCKDNTTTTVQINNIQPDASGNAEIVITSALPGGNGYLNSLTIQAIPTAAGSGSGSSGRTSLNSGNVQNAGSALTSGSGIEQEKDDVVISAYPNPFVEDILLNVSLKKKASKLVVFLKDFSGRTVFATHLMNVPAGISQHRLNVNGRTLSPGIYGIQLINASDGKGKTIKVIKN